MVDVNRGDLFLGGEIDPATGDRLADADVVYEAHHLTTHGVIVGMTGSGKTGLGIVALEEALLSGIPCLILDPKGDMGNLLLNFPSFEAAAFRPWIDEGEARRADQTPEACAAGTAERWRDGLAGWGIGADRMRRLGMTAEFAVYTPGSQAGIPVNVVGSLAAPALDWSRDAETIRDEIEGFVSSLLVLAGIDADPISSPEPILLSTIIEKAWTAGRSLDLATLIAQVQDPPIRKLGVFDLDTFFPPNDRTKLAMRLNGLVASPSFAAWLEGPPLDVGALLRTADGRPRASVVYLAHLSDSERQFIVTLLLSKVVTWMRTQPGTSDLRALVYMDEVFGFAPPTAEPPSKKPILTLLKQARAFGVGLLLSTQNPVDLDYKAMSNSGTWMIGRLQTERDKARILEGLRSAAGGVDVDAFDRLISGLGKRQFVLHSTKASAPTVFTTRWAMSYLAGPLSRDQVARLMADHPGTGAARTGAGGAAGTGGGPGTEPAGSTRPASPPTATATADDETPVAPTVADGVRTWYLDPAAPWAAGIGAVAGGTRHEAGLVARVDLLYDDRTAGVDHREAWEAVVFPLGASFDAAAVHAVDYDDRDLRAAPTGAVAYALPDAPIDGRAYWSGIERDLRDWLAQHRAVTVFRNPSLKRYSRVGETEDAFVARCREAAEDAADAEAAKLRDKFRARIETVQGQIRTAELRARELELDAQTRKQTETVSVAGDLLGAFLGGRARASSLKGVASRRSQTRRTEQRLKTARTKVSDRQADLEELEDRLADDLAEIVDRWQMAAAEVETIEVGLEKSDIRVADVALVWVPTR